jgi:ubiquinone/menaquinone biosynthesis C-methylase UbiE
MLDLRQEFLRGGNLTQFLEKVGIEIDANLIEFIYDLQAGSYTTWGEKNPGFLERHVSEIAKILEKYVAKGCTFLDAGIGEGTSLIPLMEKLEADVTFYGVDISYSRLSWAKHQAEMKKKRLNLAVGELSNLPIQDNSIDCVLTVHSIEPNGGRELEIVSELARVSRKNLILIEPDWDKAQNNQRQRMRNLGYITSLRPIFGLLNLKIIDEISITNVNEENKATAFVLEKNNLPETDVFEPGVFVDPIYRESLHEYGTGLRSEFGLWFPILNGIPFLRSSDVKLCISPHDEIIKLS